MVQDIKAGRENEGSGWRVKIGILVGHIDDMWMPNMQKELGAEYSKKVEIDVQVLVQPSVKQFAYVLFAHKQH